MEERIHMNDQWIEYAIKIQSIAQAGIQYGKDPYDRECYEELRKISAEMIAKKTDIGFQHSLIKDEKCQDRK